MKRYFITTDKQGKPIYYRESRHLGGIQLIRVSGAEAETAKSLGEAEILPLPKRPNPRRMPRTRTFRAVSAQAKSRARIITRTMEILQAEYRPDATRADLVAAVREALDVLSG